MTKVTRCEACQAPEASLRVCTKQTLCETCRSRPEYRIMTCASVRKALDLPESAFIHLRAGRVNNPVDPRFRRMSVYFWKDVAAFCAHHDLEIPE